MVSELVFVFTIVYEKFIFFGALSQLLTYFLKRRPAIAFVLVGEFLSTCVFEPTFFGVAITELPGRLAIGHLMRMPSDCSHAAVSVAQSISWSSSDPSLSR